METKLWLNETENMVKETLAQDSSGHDWWHIVRVRQLALFLARQEGGDLFIVEMSALLHDICDWKLNDGDEALGLAKVEQFLERIYIPIEMKEKILDIIGNVSFKGAGCPDHMVSLEGQIVQDADRLDALGAIGIARTFAYGGAKNQVMHHPEIAPTHHKSFSEYKSKQSSSINHFYEKLFLLKERLHTATAQNMAQERHRFMEQFVAKFLLEWDGIV